MHMEWAVPAVGTGVAFVVLVVGFVVHVASRGENVIVADGCDPSLASVG